MFGDAEVMSIKVIWDYTFYWGVLCQLVFQDRLTDMALLGSLRSELDQAQELNRRMQMFFRAWHLESRGRDDAVMLDQRDLGWFVAMNRKSARRADHRSARRSAARERSADASARWHDRPSREPALSRGFDATRRRWRCCGAESATLQPRGLNSLSKRIAWLVS